MRHADSATEKDRAGARFNERFAPAVRAATTLRSRTSGVVGYDAAVAVGFDGGGPVGHDCIPDDGAGALGGDSGVFVEEL